jgi:thioester reductase-like protein
VYHLLTGSTGLLGSALLRSLLLQDWDLALLVRDGRRQSARERIEELIAPWERQLGRALPRPVILRGDITQPGLGLQPAELGWISAHVRSCIHSAASLTFVAPNKQAEPWLSNLLGAQHVLDVCRQAGIRKFHHVSTAYVCGLRSGRVLESEVDVGHETGNDYEASKLAAEKLVRQADFLDNPTIYRPAIIVGDSKTGATTQFHGFYVPLKVFMTMHDRLPGSGQGGGGYRAALGLAGHERKNLVPVDWVADVMTHVLTHPELHGQTYHLTSPTGATSQAIETAIDNVVRRNVAPPTRSIASADFFKLFAEQLTVYRAYWRDDPQFDSTNTQRAAPHLPCPKVDVDLLVRLCEYAVAAQFGAGRRATVNLPAAWPAQWSVPAPTEHTVAAPGDLGLRVQGPGGGQWRLACRDGVWTCQAGLSGAELATFRVNRNVWDRLLGRDLREDLALAAGQVLVEGPGASNPLAPAWLSGFAGVVRSVLA